jgi:SAM-dependent methyltransferase
MYSGHGPGPITRDGCAVELYLRLPYRGEVELLGGDLAESWSVLELGCGVGRITRRLLATGHDVTAVDNSSEMLELAPREVAKAHADIETLTLPRCFDAVLLASNLINVCDESVRGARIKACRRHLPEGGKLLFERFDPDWMRTVEPGLLGTTGPVQMFLDDIRRDGATVAMTLRYEADGAQWLQSFTAQILDDADVDAALAAAGFAPARWITRRWGCAVAS